MLPASVGSIFFVLYISMPLNFHHYLEIISIKISIETGFSPFNGEILWLALAKTYRRETLFLRPVFLFQMFRFQNITA